MSPQAGAVQGEWEDYLNAVNAFPEVWSVVEFFRDHGYRVVKTDGPWFDNGPAKGIERGNERSTAPNTGFWRVVEEL